MSNKKPFKAGEKVTTAGGARCVVVVDQHGGQPVHIETAKGVEPYRTTYVPAESLKRGHGRQKANELPETLEPGTYLVPFVHEDEQDDAAVLTVYVETTAAYSDEALRATALEQAKADPDVTVDLDGYIAGTPERVEARA